jgi:hypothetical protein
MIRWLFISNIMIFRLDLIELEYLKYLHYVHYLHFCLFLQKEQIWASLSGILRTHIFTFS